MGRPLEADFRGGVVACNRGEATACGGTALFRREAVAFFRPLKKKNKATPAMIKSHHIESLRPESVFQNIGGIISDFDHHWESTFTHIGRSEGDSRWSHLLTSANAIYLPIVT
ncbi:hypothetical protein [Hyphococcus sp.]|uniref:hypothetical protein n=1 Tax=Hyphococcus sp. TaxID=2038636 RepID=UPI003CCB92B3